MKTYRSILFLAFAILVLFSSSNLIVGIHFCAGKVQNVAIFSKADGCDREKKLPPCHRHETPPCCRDVVIVHEGQDFKNVIAEIKFYFPLIACIASHPVVISKSVFNQTEKEGYTYYDPPGRTLDLTVMHKVFLI
ncbi:MAG: hypothetical protein ABIS36_12695 [Chryseolinea sp.]